MYRRGLSDLWQALFGQRREWSAMVRPPSRKGVRGDGPTGSPGASWKVPIDVARVFEVGRRVDIMVGQGAEGRVYLSRIEGMGDRAIMAAMPMERRFFVPLADGLPVKLRLSFAGGLYYLETKVIGYRFHPLPVVFFDKYGELCRQENRRAPRVAVFIEPMESLLARGGGWHGLKMTILDISAGGFLFVGGESVPPGLLVRARFELPRFGQISAISEVVRVEARSERAHRMGTCFSTLTDRDTDRISRFVLRHQMEMRGKGLGR